MPAYEPPSITYDGDILCDGENTVPLSVNIENGIAPFSVSELKCNEPTSSVLNNILERTDSNNLIIDLPFGPHCLVLQDVCENTRDFQVSVRRFKDSIDYAYNCEAEILLATDSLTAIYEWKNEELVMGNQHEITANMPDTTTNYTVDVSFGNCQLSRSVTLQPRSIVPTAIITTDQALPILCGTKDTILLSVETDGIQTIWNSTDTTSQILVTTSGAYQVTAINDLGCEKVVDIFIEQRPLPTPAIEQLALCKDDTETTIFVTDTFPKITWMTGEQSQQILAKKGAYSVTVTDAANCIGESTFEVERTLLDPQLSILDLNCYQSNDGLIAVDEVVAGKASYKWKIGLSEFDVPWETNALSAGDYPLKITDSQGCTWDTIIQLSQPPPLELDLGSDQRLDFGDSLELQATSNFSDWNRIEWLFNNQLFNDTEENPTICPNESGVVQLTVANTHGCKISNNFQVFVRREVPIYAPNIFSPNGDGENDLFMLYAKNNTVKIINSLRIVNRWGSLVYAANEVMPGEGGWDGRVNNQIVDNQTFVWMAEIVWKDDKREVLTGDVTVFRK